MLHANYTTATTTETTTTETTTVKCTTTTCTTSDNDNKNNYNNDADDNNGEINVIKRGKKVRMNYKKEKSMEDCSYNYEVIVDWSDAYRNQRSQIFPF